MLKLSRAAFYLGYPTAVILTINYIKKLLINDHDSTVYYVRFVLFVGHIESTRNRSARTEMSKKFSTQNRILYFIK